MPAIDLNCDLGEGFADDASLMALVSSVNIACGGHAGDDATMRASVTLAQSNGANVGAHPGYDDREHFGRVAVNWPVDRVIASVDRQVRRLAEIAAERGVVLTHVKPHGALYHAANGDRALACRFVEAVRAIDESFAIIGPPAGELASAATAAGVRLIGEAFVDRRYRSDGTLVPRSEPDATIHDADAAATQAIDLILNGRVMAVDGRPVGVRAATLCVHGDGALAVATLTALHTRLRAARMDVRPFRSGRG